MGLFNHILVIGPDPDARGGISMVIKIWIENNLLEKYNVKYISTVSYDEKSKIITLIKAFIVYIKLLRDKYEIVYIHTSSSNGFYRKSIFIIIGILFSKKIILHIHPSHFCEFYYNAKYLKKLYIHYVLKKVDAFVVLSNSSKEFLKSYFPEKSIYVIENPINVSKMENTSGIQREPCDLLYLGKLSEAKGVYDLVDALEIVALDFPNIHLDFFGNGEVEKLKSYIKTKELSNSISVNTWITFERKIEELYRHTFLILPSYSEGIPNVILEAMSTKLPVISTAVGGLKEILIDKHNCLITEVGNPAGLAETIVMYLEDQQLRKEITETAYMDVKNKFDIIEVKKKVNNLFEAMGA